MGKKMTIAILVCVAVVGGCIATYSAGKAYDNYVELRQLRADRANGVVQEQIWEVHCWDEALEQHSVRYVSPARMDYEIEADMCEAMITK